MKKSTIRVTIVIICSIVAIVGYYAYLSSKTRAEKAEATMSAVQTVLSRDLTNGYPSTPKEVIKYYNEIMKCFYNEETLEQEIEDLGNKARELYDEELLAANDLAGFMASLKEEVATYREKEQRLTNCAVAASTDVDFYSVDGHSFARIKCGYTVVEDGNSYPMTYTYLLRRDEEKHWKIYGWQSQTQLQGQAQEEEE